MAERQLADMLAVPLQRARQLLAETGGDLESAVALHFANPGGGPQAPQSPRSELCTLLGGSITRTQAGQLLRRSGNSIAAAADLYFEDPAAAGPPGGTGGAAGAREAACHRGDSSDPITMSEDSEAETTEDSQGGDSHEGEEEEEQPVGRRGSRVRPASAGRGGRGSGGRGSGGRGASEGRGLVRSPRAMPGGVPSAGRLDAGVPGGVGELLARLLGGPLFGGEPGDEDESDSEYGESDEDGYGYGYGGYGYSEEEELEELEELPPTPRLGPKLTEQMPDLNSAAAGWVQARMLPADAAEAAPQQAGPSNAAAAAAAAAAAPTAPPAPAVAPELLPLPHMRLEGKLFTDNQDLVPAAVEPAQPLHWPLKLGTIVLPLATLNEERLKAAAGKQHWSALEWSGKSKLFHDYVGPGNVFRQLHLNRVAKPLPLSELSGWGFSVPQLEQQARLALYGREKDDDVPLASVREEHTWVSELLYSLWVLETAGIADIRCRLVAEPGQQAQQAQQAQQQDPGQQQPAQQPERHGSPSPDPAEQQQQQQQQQGAGGSGGARARSRSKGRSKSREAPPAADAGAEGAAAAAAAGAGPSRRGPMRGRGAGAGRGKSKSRSKSRSATPAPASDALPRGVRVEIMLTQSLQHQLWYDGEDGDLTEQMEDKKGGRKITARGAQAKWTKNGTALGRIVSALLHFGSGLSLGPDADGLLNLGDVPAREWREVAEPPPAQRRAMFDVARLLDSVAYKRQGLMAPAPQGLATTPKQYQLSGLQWMLNREAKGDALGRGQLRLHPAWLQLVAEDGQLLYLHRLRPHVVSPNFYSAPVGGTCGGFLVDEMGLGKTLQTLMLVLSNPPPAGWAVKRLEGLTATEDSEAVPIKTSLIVMPANLLGQWAEEIERHVQPGRLSWARYLPPGAAAAAAAGNQADEEDGDVATRTRRSRRVAAAGGTVNLARGDPLRPILCRTPDGQLKPMHELDVVLMSYEQLRDQLYASGSHTSLLAQFGFWRVVLDEAQLVANSSSVAAVVASSLWRRHAWVVTGTPISNKLDEIKGLLEFLAAEPYHHAPVWRGLLQSSYEAQSVGGLLSLRSLLRGVMLRRSKADVAGELELPPCTREDRWVSLSSVERLCYEQSKRAFCDAAYQVQQQQGVGQHASRVRHTSKAVGRALAAFTGLRQSCCHPQIVRRIVDDVLGKERKSMRDIMGALVVKAYGEWDQAARRLVDAKLIEAAVAAGVGAHPEEALRPLLELILANQRAASSTGIREQASSNRRMFAEVADAGEGSAAAAGGSDDGAGTSAAAAAQVAGGNVQPVGIAAADDKGKAPMPAEPPQQQQQQPTNGRKRRREGSEGPSSAAAASGSQQQDGGAGAEQAAAAGNADQQLAEAMQAEEDAAAAEQQQPPTQEEKEATARLRAWRKLELDALELFAHMLKNIGSKAKGKAGRGKGKGQQQQQQQQQQQAAAPPPTKRPRRGEAAVAGTADGSQAAAGEPAGSAAAAAAAASGSQQPVDKAVVQAQLESTLGQIEALRSELRLRADGLGDGQLMRRSRRRAGVDVDEEVYIDVKEAEEQLLNAKVILRGYTETLARRDPEKSARTTVRAAEKECQDTWHHLQHMLNKESALLAADKGKGHAEEGDGVAQGDGPADQAAGDVEQADLNTCPICLDDLSTRTITSCGHHYCPPCIREVLAHGNRTCPICRTALREQDLFDAVSEEEARLNAAVRSATDGANADFGAKVSVLLSELAAMRAADPGAKAVVFSSWGRLLKLVGDALDQNGVRHATLAGANPAQREDALHAFLHDPDCVVLTVVMSTSGGAAGLTLTVAHTAFLLEPSLNPGLEAQAAARICRLGQTKPTRVVRLLAQDSVEKQVLEVQRHKLERGDVPESGATALADVDAGMLLQIYEAVK